MDTPFIQTCTGCLLPVPALWVPLVLALLVLSVNDLRCGLLPDRLTLGLLWGGLLTHTFFHTNVPLPIAVLGASIGYGSLWFLGGLFRLLRGYRGMGYGDYKLFAATGAWLGLTALPWVLLIASLGALGVVAWRWIAHRLHRKAVHWRASLPFGPWLSLGALVVLLWSCLLRCPI